MNARSRRLVLVAGLASLAALAVARVQGEPGAAPRTRDSRAPAFVSGERHDLEDVAFLPDRDEGESGLRFVSRSLACPIAISPAETVLAERVGGDANDAGSRCSPRRVPAMPGDAEPAVPLHVLRMRAVGVRAEAVLRGESLLGRRTNVYLGDDPSAWRTGVPNYARVRTLGAYPGIDLVHHARGRTLEFDFEVAPGADPSQIALAFSADGETSPPKVTVEASGGLVVATSKGSVRLELPAIYQDAADGRRAIDGRFVLRRGAGGGDEIAFDVAEYDRSRTLVIDPSVVTSTYLGGAATDTARDLRISSAGRVYAYGETTDFSFLANTTPAGGTTTGDIDAYVVEFDGAGRVLRDAVFGGTKAETALRLAINSNGGVTAVGISRSGNFPQTSGTYAGTVVAAQDGQPRSYAIAFTPDLSLSASTRIRAGSTEFAYSVAACPNDDVVIGLVSSAAFPTTAGVAYPTPPAGSSGALLRLDAALTTVVAATFLPCTPFDVDTFAGGDVIVTGQSTNASAPTVAAAQPVYGGVSDGFVVRLDGALRIVRWATYFGGTGQDGLFSGVTLDPPLANGVDFFATGFVASPGSTAVPVTGESHHGANDIPLIAFTTAGAIVSYSNLGGTGYEIGSNVVVYTQDGQQKGVVVVGSTDSFSDYPALPDFAAGGGVSDVCVDLRPFGTGADPLPPAGAERFRYGSTGGDVPSGADVMRGVAVPKAPRTGSDPFAEGDLHVCTSAQGGMTTTDGSANAGADDVAFGVFRIVEVCFPPPRPEDLRLFYGGRTDAHETLFVEWDQPAGGSDPVTFELVGHQVGADGNESESAEALEPIGPGRHAVALPVDPHVPHPTSATFSLVAVNCDGRGRSAPAHDGTFVASKKAKVAAKFDPKHLAINLVAPDLPFDLTIAVAGGFQSPAAGAEGIVDAIVQALVDDYRRRHPPGEAPGKPKPVVTEFLGTFRVPAHTTTLSLPLVTTGLTAKAKVSLTLRFNGRTKKLKFTLKPPR